MHLSQSDYKVLILYSEIQSVNAGNKQHTAHFRHY